MAGVLLITIAGITGDGTRHGITGVGILLGPTVDIIHRGITEVGTIRGFMAVAVGTAITIITAADIMQIIH